MSEITHLVIFYDSYCPLCMAEMRHLHKRNTNGKLDFVDINDETFADNYPQFNHAELNARIHGLANKQQVITGLDVTYHAWRLVGMGWLYAPLRWRIFRPIADWFYIKFAKHRYRISYWLTGKARCDTCRQSL